jgi:hypothetical protein
MRRFPYAARVDDAPGQQPQPRELNAEQLSALYGAQRRVRSALRQERRLQNAWVRHGQVLARYPAPLLETIPEPADVTDVWDQLSDETYYLLLIAHHALVKGRQLVRDTGLSLPEPKTNVVVEKLRDVYEHWDNWHGPTLKPEDLRRWSKTSRSSSKKKNSSGKYLASEYPQAFPRSYGGDDHHLDSIARVLDLQQLRGDLDYQDHALEYWLRQHANAISR